VIGKNGVLFIPVKVKKKYVHGGLWGMASIKFPRDAAFKNMRTEVPWLPCSECRLAALQLAVNWSLCS
jgi:hypothetical protein